jgi:hypothetical protein
LRVSGIGTVFRDDLGQIMMTVLAMPAGQPRMAEALMEATFPGGPETVKLGELTGILRHRRRDRDGGGYDGFYLTVTAGARVLMVTVADAGEPSARWETFRPNLMSIRWNPSEVDAETAAGFSAGPIEGMRLRHDIAGPLSYEVDGSDKVTFDAWGLPPALRSDGEACFSALRKATERHATVGVPQRIDERELAGCEIDTLDEAGNAFYEAIVSIRQRGTVMISARAPAGSNSLWRPRFAKATRSVHGTR